MAKRADKEVNNSSSKKTPAQKRAQVAYMQKFDRIALRVAPEMHERIKASASDEGKSVNGYIVEAVTEKMERKKEQK